LPSAPRADAAQGRAEDRKATRKEFPNGITAVGADALRFTFAALASHGRDIKFDFNRCEGYKNFCNKLWNAARFVLMNTEVASLLERTFTGAHAAPRPTEPERWILSRLAATIDTVHAQLADYRFDLASQALYEFTWNEYCDWFLELAKPALEWRRCGSRRTRRATRCCTCSKPCCARCIR
jgi:valyl-tRNA synthetase